MIEEIELSHQNHFKWGYGVNYRSHRMSPLDNWRVEYGKVQSHVGDWRAECVRAARLLADKHLEPTLCLSGGIDSEVMLRSFLQAGVPFKAVALRFANEKNEHDMYWVERSCRRLGVPVQYVDLDVKRFLYSGAAVDYASVAQCVSPELLATMWLTDQIDKPVVFGSGECFLMRDERPEFVPGCSPYERDVKWHLVEKENVASWYRFFKARQRLGSPGFFQYTPELIFSFLNDKLVVSLTTNQIKNRTTSKTSKALIYSRYWRFEPRIKYTGYEKLRPLVYDLYSYLVNIMPGGESVYKSEVEILKAEMQNVDEE